jgi:hypothetical protein
MSEVGEGAAVLRVSLLPNWFSRPPRKPHKRAVKSTSHLSCGPAGVPGDEIPALRDPMATLSAPYLGGRQSTEY